jgi:hypothetical protein
MRITSVAVSVLMTLGLAACDRQSAETRTQSAAAAASATNAFKPVATVKQVMLGITVPASNTVFAVAGEAPADDAGWQAVEASAMAVAESGNLLLMKPRAVDDHEWTQFALALVNAGSKAAEAARTKNAEQTGIAGDDMYNVCEQCHAKYMKEPEVTSPPQAGKPSTN